MSAFSLIRDPLMQYTGRHKFFEEIAREVEFFMNTAAGPIVQPGDFATVTVRTAAIRLFKRLIKIDPASGFRFLTDFWQKVRVVRKEIVRVKAP